MQSVLRFRECASVRWDNAEKEENGGIHWTGELRLHNVAVRTSMLRINLLLTIYLVPYYLEESRGCGKCRRVLVGYD